MPWKRRCPHCCCCCYGSGRWSGRHCSNSVGSRCSRTHHHWHATAHAELNSPATIQLPPADKVGRCESCTFGCQQTSSACRERQVVMSTPAKNGSSIVISETVLLCRWSLSSSPQLTLSLCLSFRPVTTVTSASQSRLCPYILVTTLQLLLLLLLLVLHLVDVATCCYFISISTL